MVMRYISKHDSSSEDFAATCIYRYTDRRKIMLIAQIDRLALLTNHVKLYILLTGTGLVSSCFLSAMICSLCRLL